MTDYTKHHSHCLDNAADDEPVFVLRAQDALAVEVIHHWADLLEANNGTYAATEKASEARDIADAMEDWQTENGSKMPD